MPAGDHAVNVNYSQIEYSLTIVSANGTVVKNPDQTTYHEDDVVQLTATPTTGWSFANWTGGLTGSANPGSVTIHGNTSVTANYTQNEYILTITSAHGTVAKNPDQATYHEGDMVQLMATPTAGWSFVNWTGGLTGTANPASVTFHGNISVTANYNQLPTDIALSNNTVTENLPIGTTVGTLTTTDAEAGDTHTYSFCGGANDASFSIVGNALNTAAIFDFETKNTYDICLRTNDGNGGTFDKNFVITLTNVPGLELLTPANAVNVHTLRPTFDWVNYPGAIGYNIQISRNNTFTQIVNNTLIRTAASTFTPILNLQANKLLYWRVRAKLTATTYSGWSEVRSFLTGNPPGIPLLVSPASNALVTSTTPLLNWNNSNLPAGTTFDKYEVEISLNNTFTAVVANLNVFGLANSQVNTPVLLNATTYYWRVRSWNTNGDFSAWTTARSFRTPFAAPILLLPGNGATGIARTPTFTWTPTTGATSYSIQVSRNASFTLLVVSKTVYMATYSHTSNLLLNTVYYWRVRINGPYGPSPWSATYQFTTTP